MYIAKIDVKNAYDNVERKKCVAKYFETLREFYPGNETKFYIKKFKAVTRKNRP